MRLDTVSPYGRMQSMISFHFKATDTIAVLVAVILAIAGVATDNSILFALCWLGAAATLIYVVIRHKDLKSSYKIAVSLLILAAATGVSWRNYYLNYEKAIRVSAGILYPGTGARPNSRCNKDIPDNALAIYYAGGVAWTTSNRITLVIFHGAPLIQFERLDNSEIHLTNMTILDDRNQVAAQTADNKFEIKDIAKGEMPTNNRLYVKDYNDKEIFNIELINSSTISITGRFSDMKGSPIIITDEQIVLPGHNVFTQPCFGGFTAAAILVN
jgi:hypothetical protein